MDQKYTLHRVSPLPCLNVEESVSVRTMPTVSASPQDMELGDAIVAKRSSTGKGVPHDGTQSHYSGKLLHRLTLPNRVEEGFKGIAALRWTGGGEGLYS